MIAARTNSFAFAKSAAQWKSFFRPLAVRMARLLVLGGRDKRGSTLVEVAVILPTLFLFLWGLFDFSIVLFGYSNATYASRAAARYASLHSSTSLAPSNAVAVQNVATQYLWAAPAGGVTVTTTWSPANTIGGTVNVFVKVAYPVGVPLLTLHQITVASTAQRTIQR
jgi:Flp pilus assembly protein TadG